MKACWGMEMNISSADTVWLYEYLINPALIPLFYGNLRIIQWLDKLNVRPNIILQNSYNGVDQEDVKLIPFSDAIRSEN